MAQQTTRRVPTFYAMTGENQRTTMLVVGNNRDDVESAARRLITERGDWPSLRAVTYDRNLVVWSYTQMRKHFDDETIYQMQYDAISPDGVDDALESIRTGWLDDAER